MIDANEELGGVPDPRVVVENTETPVFQIDPSPTYAQNAVPVTHKRRHHRGIINSESANLQSLSIMPTPTYVSIPIYPLLPFLVWFFPFSSRCRMLDISNSRIYTVHLNTEYHIKHSRFIN